jgi:hypothetical protein
VTSQISVTEHTGTSYPPFSGGHDNGYTSTLTALENEQLLGKLVIFQGYNEIANELQKLSLPSLKVDGLFMTQKLPYIAKKPSPVVGAVGDDTVTNEDSNSPRSPNPSFPRLIDPSLVNIIGLLGCALSDFSHSPFTNARRNTRYAFPLQLTSVAESPPPCNEHYLMTCSKSV